MGKDSEKQPRKREKLFERMEKVKPEQVDLVRFVDVRWEVMTQAEDGTWHRTGREHGHGLQIENRFYPVAGPYKMVNRKTFRIAKSYDGIPEWATEELKAMYKREWEARGLDKRKNQPTRVDAALPAKVEGFQVSARAMDILAVMQSSPNREYSFGSLKACAHAGSRTVHKCIDELEDAGYLVKKQIGRRDGKPGREVYLLSANQQPPRSDKARPAPEPDDDLPPW